MEKQIPPLNVLVACESSGVVSKAFRDLGHRAWSCDILPKDGLDQSFHVEGDVLDLLANRKVKATDSRGRTLSGVVPFRGVKWDLLIGHPPCTYLCNSGVRWLITYVHPDEIGATQALCGSVGHYSLDRWRKMEAGAKFFADLFGQDIPHIAVENPVMHRYAASSIAKHLKLNQPKIKATQFVQPWMFGHGETKMTGLWLKNLPKLVATDLVSGREHRVHRMPPGPNRWKERSKTFEGIAKAMAAQWSAHIIAEKQKG